MKKQLLILVLALFASFQIFAQTPHDPPTCDGTAATPAVGIPYVYEVNIPAGLYSETNGQFDWYVMDQGQLNLMTGTHIPAVNTEFVASGHYDITTVGANTITITWTAAALASGEPYFLVVVFNDATATCPTNNMKVYRIDPMNSFWLAVDNVTTTQCSPDVSSAILAADFATVTYEYGTNQMEITITAGGYTGDWDAQLQLGGFDADQTLAISWTAAVAGTNGTFTDPGSGNNGVWTATLPASTTVSGTPAVTTNETITITIDITNNNFENLAGLTVDLAIDGSYTSGGTTFDDLSDVNGPCTPESVFADAVQQTLTARPTIEPVTPAAFVPQTP